MKSLTARIAAGVAIAALAVLSSAPAVFAGNTHHGDQYDEKWDHCEKWNNWENEWNCHRKHKKQCRTDCVYDGNEDGKDCYPKYDKCHDRCAD